VRCSLILVTVLLALMQGCAGPTVSPTDQTAIDQANKLHAALAPAVVEDRNPRLKRYFEQLGARITTAAQALDKLGQLHAEGDGNGTAPGAGSNDWMFARDISFHLVSSPLPNSFTAGGRHIYIYTGLFQECQNEDELASVFCREYAHLYLRHVGRSIRRDQLPNQDGDTPVIYPFANLRYPAPFARAADAVAFPIYMKAGWDPTRFASVYQRIIESGSTDAIDRALLTSRVADAQRRTDALPAEAREWAQPSVADEARFTQLRTETRSLVDALPPAPRSELLLATFPSALSPADTPSQISARQRLFPPPPAPSTENKWGKGLPGR